METLKLLRTGQNMDNNYFIEFRVIPAISGMNEKGVNTMLKVLEIAKRHNIEVGYLNEADAGGAIVYAFTVIDSNPLKIERTKPVFNLKTLEHLTFQPYSVRVAPFLLEMDTFLTSLKN